VNGLKWAKAGALAIAAGAAGLSYDHQKHLYEINAIGAWSYVVPLIVDVLALLAAVVRNVEGIPAGLKKTATWTLIAAGLGSVAANVAVAVNPVQVAVGVGTVGAYLLAENFVSAMGKAAAAKAAQEAAKAAVAMVAKADADAQLAAAMATAASDLANAVATAVAEAEQSLRATLAKEQADLLAEAERATRDAAARDAAIRADRERATREQELANQLAKAEADRAVLAARMAKTTTAKSATVKPTVASGQAAATVAAILAADADMATDDVVATAASQGVELSARTVRRVKLEMRMATAAA
jgi:hypothetical protein